MSSHTATGRQHTPPHAVAHPHPHAGPGEAEDSGLGRSWAVLAVALTAQIVAFLPFAFAITDGTVVARHLLARVSPRAITTAGLIVVAGAAAVLSTASGDASYATGILPGLAALGLRVGMVFVPVSVTSMTGIPASHSRLASGVLMTGHEVRAALGVAVLSSVATGAGSLTTAAGTADGFSRGFLAAAGLAVVVAVIAFTRMPSTGAAARAGMHMHH